MDSMGLNGGYMVEAMERRGFLAGLGAVSLVTLSGCATGGGGLGQLSLVEVIQRLLHHASNDAFATLTAQDGFWNSAVARIPVPVLFGKQGGVAQSILTSGPFREKLQKQLNNVAEGGARRAAPLVADAIRSMSVADAAALLKSAEPTAATSALRAQMGPALVNAMIPDLAEALRVANDPIVNQAVSALAGVNLTDVAHSVALGADNAIWYQIGAAESHIRANPEQTNDPLLIAGLKAAQAL
ncbi:MAG: DUF4197 domain-containing protein [Novosphingobium sp.]|nr:DUF4197 domain-containing protein [Novosphingobium sp.]